MASLRTRDGNHRVFLLSGIDGSLRRDLARKIHLLGGKYFDLQFFKAICTHVVCGRLSRSEKYLGACATGKWVLHPDYIQDSYIAGSWLDEEQYEWCDSHITNKYQVDMDLAMAARRWRFMLGGASSAFSGWKVAVIAGAKRSKVIKGLLVSGGAEVLQLRIPVRNPAKVADTLGYIFVSENNSKAFVHLIDYGVLCIKPEFIGDFLIKDPQPDPMDYLVQVNSMEELATEVPEPLNQDSFLMDSQRSMYLSPEKKSVLSFTDSPMSSMSASPSSLRLSCSNLALDKERTMTPPTSYAETLPSCSDTSKKSLPSGSDTSKNSLPSSSDVSRISLLSSSELPSILDTSKNSLPSSLDTSIHSLTSSSDVFKKALPSSSDTSKDSLPSSSDVSKISLPSSLDTSKKRLPSSSDTSKKTLPRYKPISKLVYDITDLTVDSEQPIANDLVSGNSSSKRVKPSSVPNPDSVEVIDLTDSYDDLDVGIKTRKSKRNIIKKSPVWKKLIPGRKAALKQIEIKKEIIDDVKVEDNVDNDSAGVKCDIAVRCDLMDSFSSQSVSRSTLTSTPAKTLITSQTPTRTPARTPMTKKQLLQERLNISPITKFFKHIVPTNEVKGNSLNKSLVTVSSTSTSLPVDKTLKLNRSENLSQPTCDTICSKDTVDKNQSSDGAIVNCPVVGEKGLGALNHSINIGSKQSGQAGDILIDTQAEGKELKENTEKVVVTVNKESKNKTGKVSNNKKVTRESARRPIPDDKGDRKRKSTDLTEEAAQINGPSEKKRVTRSSPLKNKDLLLVGSPHQSPSVHGLTTIVLSPSKQKSPMTRQMAAHEVTIATTKHVNGNIPQSPSGYNNEPEIIDGRPENERKRKSNNTELEKVLTHIKRQKIGSSEWCPSSLIVNLRETEDVPESAMMSSTTMEIFMCTLEDGFTFEALEYLESQVTFKYYPQSDVIIELIRNVLLKSEEERLVNKSYNILSRMLKLHPPITASLQEVYLRALAGCKIGEDSQVGAEWSLIIQCIDDILRNDDVITKRNNRVLFKFVMELLQYNIQHYQCTNDEYNKKNMLLRIIWSPSYHVVFNKRCRTLVDVISDIILQYQSVHCQIEKKHLLEMLEGVTWLVAMVTECCREHECGQLDLLQALHVDTISEFVRNISNKLADVNIGDSFLLETIIHGLQLPWLRVGVCQQLLNKFDDYLLTEEYLSDVKSLSLLLIVTRYMFLLPVLDVQPRTPGCRSPIKQRAKEVSVNHSPATVRTCLKENTDINKRAVDKTVVKVMKKNHKGETPLHVACIKNDVSTVKNLLKVPGINVNAIDNVGWTPLHEASNHGNTECVRELLKFIPSKTMDVFFTKDHTECRKVDLLAVNGEGITPLHDAVLNNKPEVCQILLQHGGSKLLETRTCLGYTPIDLAETEEMITLLSSFSTVRRKHSDSQSLIGSQGSTSSVEDNTFSVPSDILYEEVRYIDGERVYANVKSTTRYLHLVTLLVKHYINVRNLNLICRCMKDKQLLQTISEQNDTCDKDCLRENSLNNSVGDSPRYQNSSKKIPGLSIETLSSVNHMFENRQLGLLSKSSAIRDGYKLAESCVDNVKVNCVRNDLKELRKFPQYLNLFKNHLVKLCRSEDCKVIKDELQELSYLSEGLF